MTPPLIPDYEHARNETQRPRLRVVVRVIAWMTAAIALGLMVAIGLGMFVMSVPVFH